MKTKIKHAKLPDGRQGKCAWKLTCAEIIIDPSGENDQALLRHQLYHARGNLIQNWVRSIRYKLSSEFRYKEEVEAYRVQIAEMRKSKTVLVQQVVRFNNRILDSYGLPSSLSMNAYLDLMRSPESEETNLSATES